MGFIDDIRAGFEAIDRTTTNTTKAATRTAKKNLTKKVRYVTGKDDKKAPAKKSPAKSTSTKTKKAPPSISDDQRAYAQSRMDAVPGPQAPPEDPMMALFEAILAGGSGGGGGGAAPNLQDYIAGIAQGRDRVNQYQQQGSQTITQNTGDLLAKLQQITGVQQADSGQRAIAQQQATGQVQGEQDKALLLAARDLEAQGVNSEPLQAQHQQLSGQLASSTNDQNALTAKMAAMQAIADTDRAKSAESMGQGAQFTLGQNTQQQLGELDQQEAEGRRQYGNDLNSYNAQQSSGPSDIERRFALAQEFAGLDQATQVNPTVAVRNKYPSQSGVFDLLENGATVNETRIGIRADIAREKKKAREQQDTDAIAIWEDALDALGDWEKATSPDAEADAQNQQLESLRKYMGF